MFERMLSDPNIRVVLGTDWRALDGVLRYDRLVYTGPIDEFFEHAYDPLPYRSLDFEFETIDTDQVQPVATINYPNERPYTRQTEFKHLTGQAHPQTSVVREYPSDSGDPYYPVPKPAAHAQYARYEALAKDVPGVHFAGRLATYRYYNMDQVVGQALTLARRLTEAKPAAAPAEGELRLAVAGS
jgi:UDP-galactopyranose mutase